VTEQEWLTCAYPQMMLPSLRGKASDRKLRLFAVACCRRTRSPLRSKRTRRLLELSEQFADGPVEAKVLREARQEWLGLLDAQVMGPWRRSLGWTADTDLTPRQMARGASLHAAEAAANPEKEGRKQSAILRDIFGNPFRPVTLNPAWLTPDVVSLAGKAYEERAFDRLPILGCSLGGGRLRQPGHPGPLLPAGRARAGLLGRGLVVGQGVTVAGHRGNGRLSGSGQPSPSRGGLPRNAF
jgi:hypothetical protein